jgi:hypothetical protein
MALTFGPRVTVCKKEGIREQTRDGTANDVMRLENASVEKGPVKRKVPRGERAGKPGDYWDPWVKRQRAKHE